MKRILCKKVFSRGISVILSLVLVLTMVTLCVPLAGAKTSKDNFVYLFNDDGTVCIWGYTGNATELTIPNTLDGRNVTKIMERAFYEKTQLTSVTIPDSIVYIGKEAFGGCTSLTSITIPDSVTRIGGGAFCDCTSLSSITIPDGITFDESDIFYRTAYYNDNSNWIETKPDDKDNWFYGGLYIGNYLFEVKNTIKNEYKVKEGTKVICGGAFFGCSSLTEVTIPGSVTEIGNSAFGDCTSLTNVIMPEGVKEIGFCAFRGCSSLTSVTIPNGVTKIEYATFKDCGSLKKITIPGSVTEIGIDVFYGCPDEMVMYVENNSYAHRYAIDNGIKYTTTTSSVYPTKISLSKASLTLGVGEAFTLNASVTPSNAVKELTWTSNSSVLSVSDNGKLKANKAGSAVITVKSSNGKTATCKVTVKPAATKVYLNKSTLTLGVGESYQLSSWCADGTYSAKRGFGSSNNGIVYTSGNGKLTAKKPGTATITVKTFNGKTATCKVTVKPAATKVYLNKSTLTLGVGESYQLSSWCADGTYSAKRGFGSSNNGIVYTSGNGKLAAKKVGTATITVKTFNGKTATCKVTVKPAATRVYLNKTSLTLKVGESYQLTSWCQNGTYSAKRGFGSSNNGIVYTSGNGKLTAKRPGTAIITVKTFNGKTATCKVTVK